jgi:UDP-glucuronate 4-epimerase
LVTGAAGFIGSAISVNLRRNGHEVFGVDSLSSYYSVDLKLLRKNELLDSLDIKFQVTDLSDKKQVKNLFSTNRFEAIIHLAAQPGVRIRQNDWDLYTRDNLEAFGNVLLAAVEYQVPSLLYASSSSVYGNVSGHSLSEKSDSAKPISFYGATKLTNEILARACSVSSGLRTRGLRFFTVYGPWGRPDMVYFRMVHSALSGSPFNFFGTGDVKRDFTYIDDVTTSISTLLKDLTQRDRHFSDVVNIGGGRPISINECLQMIEGIIGSEIPFRRQQADPRDVALTHADFTYLKEITGYAPQISANQGFAHFVSWAKRTDIQTRLTQWIDSVP